MNNNNSELIIYITEDGKTQVDVIFIMKQFGCQNRK